MFALTADTARENQPLPQKAPISVNRSNFLEPMLILAMTINVGQVDIQPVLNLY